MARISGPDPVEATAVPEPTPLTYDFALRPLPEKLVGVTADSVWNLRDLLPALSHMARRPMVRIVFDYGMRAQDYAYPVRQISRTAYVMGEILDSFYVKRVNINQYRSRMRSYLATLGDRVDLWEVGNEVNGEWLGDTPTVVTKIGDAFDLVKANGKRAALTLYYNPECWTDPEHEMFTWARENVPERMKQGLDYVFISFYEDDCHGAQPDWAKVFAELGEIFPNSKLGFGEVGTAYRSRKKAYIERYYDLPRLHPRFVGGYFWWYFRQDMVPRKRPLWQTLDRVLRNRRGWL